MSNLLLVFRYDLSMAGCVHKIVAKFNPECTYADVIATVALEETRKGLLPLDSSGCGKYILEKNNVTASVALPETRD